METLGPCDSGGESTRAGTSPLGTYGPVWRPLLLGAHARSGDRIAIAAYRGNSDSFERAITDFANQNERESQALVDAIASGRLVAQAGL